MLDSTEQSVIIVVMINAKDRMRVWKEMAKTQPEGFTWESFKRMLGSPTMCGSQARLQAEKVLKKLDK
tara:strand:+ start:4472 stop:4675 length:204 start_codon:yes stop_codon:yes gene_type:complete